MFIDGDDDDKSSSSSSDSDFSSSDSEAEDLRERDPKRRLHMLSMKLSVHEI